MSETDTLIILRDSSWFSQGGPVMYPLLLCSIVGLSYIFYCFLTLRSKVLFPKNLLLLCDSLSSTSDFSLAESLCKKEGGVFSEIIYTVLTSRNLPREESELLIEGSGRRAAHELSSGVLVLEIIASIAPLLGLLGTVTGMYNLLMTIKEAGTKDIGMISGGIGEALITTIAGLLVAIPVYIAYSYFLRKIDDLVLLMEEQAISLMVRLSS